MPLPHDPAQGPPKLDEPHTSIVRESLPVDAARAFEMFTRSTELVRWFCDQADSQEQPNGEVHASWLDEDGEAWDRVGRWIAFEPPHLAVLEWFEVETAPPTADGPSETDQPLPPARRDILRIAIAPEEEGGCTVTVMSPLLQSGTALRGDIAAEAVRHGWRMAFAELRILLGDPG